MFLLLIACAPYPDYFDGVAPQLGGVALADGVLTLAGSDLGDTKTVVVGGRNAEIIDIADGQLTARVPDGLHPGPLAVSVVTSTGQVTLEDAVTWREAAGDERTSISVSRIDCPIEAWVTSPDGADLLFWCGMEVGYDDAWAISGPGPQPGFAENMAGYGGLLSAPRIGTWKIYEPGEMRSPKLPQQYGGNAPDEEFALVVPRDFERDLASLADQLTLIESLYYWTIEGTSEPQAWFFDEDSCYAEGATIGPNSTADSLDVSIPAGASGVWIGAEIYEEGDYTYEVTTGTAYLWDDGSADDSGTVLAYDDWSGGFLGYAVGGVIGRSDLPEDTDYAVSTTRFGETVDRGSVYKPQSFVVTEPNLLNEKDWSDLFKDVDQTVSWAGGEVGDLVLVELAVYDADIDDPNWMTELYRVVGLFPAEDESATLPAELLDRLPAAPNAVDANYDLTGYWAELTVTRHHLEALPLDEGDLVVDFTHSVNAPIGLIPSQ
jgi:hypothetical protein